MLPKLPRLRVECTGSQTLSNAVEKLINWDSTASPVYDIVYTNTVDAQKFTAKTTGLYLINVVFQFGNPTYDAGFGLYLYKDGVAITVNQEQDSTATVSRYSILHQIELNRDNYIEVKAWQRQSTATSLTWTPSDSFFDMRMIDRKAP